GVEEMDTRCYDKITSDKIPEPEEIFSTPLSYSLIVSLSEEEQLYIQKESKHEGNPWMTEEELEHHFDERLENLERKRSGTWQPWAADDNKLTLECHEGEKKEDNHVCKTHMKNTINLKFSFTSMNS
nr:hypothetical protein [Tanacetum cinerariifolium]